MNNQVRSLPKSNDFEVVPDPPTVAPGQPPREQLVAEYQRRCDGQKLSRDVTVGR